MDDERLQQIIETLEESIGTAEGTSRLSWPDDQAWLTANKVGLLRLACALLRAAKEPISPDDCRSKPVCVDANHNQVVDDDEYDIIVGPIQRMETWPEPAEAIKDRTKRVRRNDRVLLIGCGIVTFVLLTIFLAGVNAIWRSLFGH
jgi:hypothetical protein